MYEQLDIFPLHSQKTEEKYCFDDDINEIHERLIRIAKKHGAGINGDEFTVWSHVPQYGYRLWLDMEIRKDTLDDENFRNDINKVIEFAKGRNIELSCMVGACFFYSGEETASLPFSTIFLDKKRQKIK